ncbi:MBL fold metallo-hydrolase [Patescibacteria group bacterium]|nr:MBL fold metallo-hydrolase [Patescibacteria group bacterium]MBU1457881.1 MBL fold metallo-hydrolase [Patescibacteria group bacterium]
MKWWHWIMVGVLVGLVWVGVQMPDKNLHVVFCDVGQGDASLIIKGDFQMVIDGGPSGEKLLSCLGNNLPFWDRKIEVVVNTHPQKDHLGGLDELVERYKVEKLVINGVFGGGKDGERLRNYVNDRSHNLVIPQKGDVLRMGSLQFDILWPEERVGSELAWVGDNVKGPTLDMGVASVLGKNTDVNMVSVVGVLRYGNFKAMFTGDIGFDEEKKIKLEGVDVLKVAHHGSKYSSGDEFIEKTDPEVAVILVGKNTFGHPTKETLDKLEQVGAKIFRTDLDGEVEVVSDGEKYWVQN